MQEYGCSVFAKPANSFPQLLTNSTAQHSRQLTACQQQLCVMRGTQLSPADLLSQVLNCPTAEGRCKCVTRYVVPQVLPLLVAPISNQRQRFRLHREGSAGRGMTGTNDTNAGPTQADATTP